MERNYVAPLVDHSKFSSHQPYFLKHSSFNGHSSLDLTLCVWTSRSMVWRSISMGISVFCLVLLTSRLYDVDREIDLLVTISTEWIPPELWSSRATLLLSVVFVGVYILSWTWMSYTVQEDKATEEVSMKTVLLLTVFAVVDIAASMGFILVRVVIYILRNRHYSSGLRNPLIGDEHDQLTALVSLRLTTLKSSSGTTDVFVSLIIGLLALLRLYSVACACSFYSKNRQRFGPSSDKHSYLGKKNSDHRSSHDSWTVPHRIPRIHE